MVEGEKRRFWIPAQLAYAGMSGPQGTLVFDIQLINRSSQVPRSSPATSSFEEATMPENSIRVSYTAEGAKGLMKDGGTKRLESVKATLKGTGATLESFYFALGEHDAYIIVDAPDYATVSAVSLATNVSVWFAPRRPCRRHPRRSMRR